MDPLADLGVGNGKGDGIPEGRAGIELVPSRVCGVEDWLSEGHVFVETGGNAVDDVGAELVGCKAEVALGDLVQDGRVRDVAAISQPKEPFGGTALGHGLENALFEGLVVADSCDVEAGGLDVVHVQPDLEGVQDAPIFGNGACEEQDGRFAWLWEAGGGGLGWKQAFVGYGNGLP